MEGLLAAQVVGQGLSIVNSAVFQSGPGPSDDVIPLATLTDTLVASVWRPTDSLQMRRNTVIAQVQSFFPWAHDIPCGSEAPAWLLLKDSREQSNQQPIEPIASNHLGRSDLAHLKNVWKPTI